MTCPFCSENIHDDAVKCRYCKEWIDKAPSPNLNIDSQAKQSAQAVVKATCPKCKTRLRFRHPSLSSKSSLNRESLKCPKCSFVFNISLPLSKSALDSTLHKSQHHGTSNNAPKPKLNSNLKGGSISNHSAAIVGQNNESPKSSGNEMEQVIKSLNNDNLIKMAYVNCIDYEKDAVQCARNEIKHRGLIVDLDELENTSGFGQSAIVPYGIEYGGWNWGAFGLGWIWAIGNNLPGRHIWLALLIPLWNLFYLGKNANKLAWQYHRWESEEHFSSVQKRWKYCGIIVIMLPMLFIFLTIIILWLYGSYSSFN